MRFSDLFAQTTSRTEVVVTFLALLELIRMKQLRIEQSEPFAEIEIGPALPPPPPLPGEQEATAAEPNESNPSPAPEESSAPANSSK